MPSTKPFRVKTTLALVSRSFSVSTLRRRENEINLRTSRIQRDTELKTANLSLLRTLVAHKFYGIQFAHPQTYVFAVRAVGGLNREFRA